MIRVGVNEQNEVVAVTDIPDGLTIIEVPDIVFQDNEPTDYKVILSGSMLSVIPKKDYQLKRAAREVYEKRISDLETLVLQLGGVI